MRAYRRALLLALTYFCRCGLAAGAISTCDRVGRPGGWADTIAAAVHQDYLYTVETSGRLYRTDPLTGDLTAVGGAEFRHTAFMTSVGDWLYTIERDGTLYRVSSVDGEWVRVGRTGDWAGAVAVAALPPTAPGGGWIMTAHRDGALYATQAASGRWTRLGGSDFANTRQMAAIDGWLYTIEANGSLYRVDPSTGRWQRVGQPGAWNGARVVAALRDRLYTIDSSGTLYRTDPRSGRAEEMGGSTVFEGVTHMLPARGRLYLISGTGDLLRLDPASEQGGGDELPTSDGASTTDVADELGREHTADNPASWLGITTDGTLMLLLRYYDAQGVVHQRRAEGAYAEIEGAVNTWTDIPAAARASILKLVSIGAH